MNKTILLVIYHPRNFGSDKIVLYIHSFMLVDVKWYTDQLGVQGIYYLCSLDVGHPCYGQLTAVKKGYLLTSVS